MKSWKRYSVLFMGLVILLSGSVVACGQPAPPEFEVASLEIAPPEVAAAETVSITARVENVGGTTGTYTVTLTIDGVKIQTKVVKVAARSVETVAFAVVRDEPGIYHVEVNELSGTLRVVKPAEFTVSNLLIDPPIAEIGEAVTVTADVTNAGEVEGSYSAALLIDGRQVETKELVVAPGATETVSFAFTEEATGSYSVEVGEVSGHVVVTETGDALAELNAVYPELYRELLELPDLAEMDAEDNEAIEDIAYLALNPEYKAAFESMLDEGIRDRRKYCAPLEALLWIAYDREFDGDSPLQQYSLGKLMNDAWENTTTSEHYASERWQHFDEVVDRLNSPKLIEIYLQDNFTYSYKEGEAEGVKSAERVFGDKQGACYDHAVLAGYCLKKNGYDEAQGMALSFDRQVGGYFIGHITCVFQDPKDSLYYTVDNVGGSRVHGPFQSVQDAAEDACRRASSGQANLRRYSLHDIDLASGKYESTWWLW